MKKTDKKAGAKKSRGPENTVGDLTSAGKSFFLNLLVFTSGATVMAVEMSSSRLLAPFFGSSLFVWTNLIGVVLAFLSLGYWLGGRIADRWPRLRVLCGITLIAGLFIGVIPFIARPVMMISFRPFGEFTSKQFYGSLLATVGILGVPNLMLGCVMPFAVRIKIKSVAEGGRTTGSLYGISTAGSIVGTFIPVLVTIPYVGTRMTFVVFSTAMIVVSGLGLGLAFLLLLVVPAGMLMVYRGPIRSPRRAEQEVLSEKESPYNYLQIVEESHFIKLIVSEGLLIHSKWLPGSLLTGSYWDYFLLSPLCSPNWGKAPGFPDDVLVLGLGSGVAVRQFKKVFENVNIDAVEIDPAMIKIAEKYFDVGPEDWRRVVIADGRLFLNASADKWDIIITDVYQESYVPFQMVTTEFFEQVRARLKPGGVMSMNLAWYLEDEPELANRIIATVRSIFKNVYLLNVPGKSNLVIVAGDDLVSPETWTSNMGSWSAAPEVHEMIFNRQPIVMDSSLMPGVSKSAVFTDDLAPVELLTDRIFFTHYIGGGG